jgi:hypothetical protein
MLNGVMPRSSEKNGAGCGPCTTLPDRVPSSLNRQLMSQSPDLLAYYDVIACMCRLSLQAPAHWL